MPPIPHRVITIYHTQFVIAHTVIPTQTLIMSSSYEE